jgi:nitroimidazol reductase NimA-like FMN-containing flavoprotein (pyridoxamine 5'-phosphate oxidase superfamily)
MIDPTVARSESIPADECRRLLATLSVGRVAFVDDGLPKILPVNYRFYEGAVIFRTDYGALLNAVQGATAAFEIDAVEGDCRSGWSVLVQGQSEEVWQEEQLVRLRKLGLRPWAAGLRDHYVRITPDVVTGRRIQ